MDETKKRICSDCDEEIVEKKTNKGRFNQCDLCSKDDTTNRYIGYNDGSLNKMTNTGIYRGDNPTVKKKLLGFRMV